MFGTLIFALSAIVFFNGADLISAEGIALIFAIIIAAMYAILTSLMPRSGGDYIFNSRIVHPAFGFSFNFSLTVWQLFSAAFTLYFIANVALGPGLQVLGYYANSTGLINAGSWLAVPLNSLIFASVVNVLFTLLILTGIRKTFSALNVMWLITILGTIVMVAALVTTTHSGFESAFNGLMMRANGTATAQNSFSLIANSVSQPPYRLSIPEIAIVADSVIWVFWAAYVAGEIRHANQSRRNITSMAGAAILNAVFFVTLVYLLYSKVGIPFLSGMSLAGTTSATLPFNSPLQAFSAVLVLSTGSFYAGLIVLIAITLGYSVLLLPALYLQPIRSVFAWSFDRVIPEKWSSVSPRFHTPVVSTLGVFVVIEAAMILITAASNDLYGIFSAAIIAPAFSSIFATSVAAIVLGLGLKRRLFGSNYRVALLGLGSLFFITFMTYIFLSNESYFFSLPAFGLSTAGLIGINFVFIPIGALVYFISYSIRKQKSKLNLNMIAGEIPPE
jgi:basic amino acid/polyamine antiporter, APA family